MLLKRLHFDTIPSTNTWPKENAHLLDPRKVTLITANTQTAGRGRYKRSWISPPDCNLYATWVWHEKTSPSALGNIPQVMCLAAASSLPIASQIKWPNDLLLSGKKVAGILCETVEAPTGGLFILLGLGLNVNMEAHYLFQIDRPATSLFLETGCHYNVEELLQKISRRFLLNLKTLKQGGFNPFYEHYRTLSCYKHGAPLQLSIPPRHLEGYFCGFTPDGGLLLENKGEVISYFAGELI